MRLRRFMAVTAVLALFVAACGDDDDDGGDEGATDTEQEASGENTGRVNVLAAVEPEEAEVIQTVLDEHINADADYTAELEASGNFEEEVEIRAEGGTLDVILLPQPGAVIEHARSGRAISLEDMGFDIEELEAQFGEYLLSLGEYEGEHYGMPTNVNLKSMIWYPKQAFDEAGYEVPETWDDMVALTEQIAEDIGGEAGRAPWCIGIDAADSTGWVATDWIEDIMMRMHGPEVYDQWVAGELPFDSDEVRAAFEEMERIWMTEEFVVGGTTGILQTPFGDAAAPMFNDPPGCYMHRQAGFIEANFPDDAEAGTTYDVVVLPPMDESIGNGALTGGDIAAIHTDNPVAAEFVEFLVSAEGQEAWMGHEGAGSLSVRTDFDPEAYPSDALARQGEILANADFARFDGSDSMPGQVGAGAFWTEIVAWISGSQDLDTTLQNIDAAWPTQ